MENFSQIIDTKIANLKKEYFKILDFNNEIC